MQQSDDHVSFERDILPLFRAVDVEHMKPMDVLLDQYEFMSDPDNAQAVYEYLSGEREPRMPPGGPYWDERQMGLLSKWISDGRQP
ncbi:MAG TPA: hypothetical protein VGN11_05120 [Candidatus Baltobacteraceae bacterium]|jgi:hypothetical protein|nr:hypothetical protein [Candidatus Baltobacteraceae bacterium]